MNSVLAVLISALVAVESGGRLDAIGDGGRAVGVLQIHAECVSDVSRITGEVYTLDDRLSAEKSRAMCIAYLKHYGRLYERRTCRLATAEVYARIWNGGPMGYNKSSTRAYWEKVKGELRKQGRAYLAR